MFREKARYGGDPNTVVRSKTKFNEPLNWAAPRMVFTCSWSDWFIAEADEWRDEAWGIIKRTPHLTYQILTKRPERIADHLPQDWGDGYPNVWLGVSVENQEQAYQRIPYLLGIPARVRFLSCEPLLGLVNLGNYLDETNFGVKTFQSGIHWVIVGGESGPGFRTMDLDWARFLRDQCVIAKVPFFFKQESGLRSGMNPTLDGVEWHQFPRVTGI